MILESEALEIELKKLPNILSIKEAAFFLRVSYAAIHRLILSKQLKAFKIGVSQSWNIKKEELIKFACLHETL
ncbi:helix-turn-helix domain-containing protein [Treponema putidum]|uniref:DNA-binding protein n=1 Tax=Treponema putidum TaxID=221027 RepID=A0ABY5I034_9SPIR|nr:DNA-binding protein [Treponema putidum]